MTRQTIKNRVNKILRKTTSGFFTDNYWAPVTKVFNDIKEAGFDIQHDGCRYFQNNECIPVGKTWYFKILIEGKKPIPGVLTAHGAGTLKDPLSRYDISAYVS